MLINTKRLRIRNIDVRDADDLYEIRNTEFILKYNCMEKVSLPQLEHNIMDFPNDSFSIVLKENNKVIGTIAFEEDNLRYQVKSVCLSYYLGETYTHKGYMSEAMIGMMNYLFNILNQDVIGLRIFKENHDSILLAKRLGFVYEGCLRHAVKAYQDVIYDDCLFSLTKEEFNHHYSKDKLIEYHYFK